MRGSYEVIVGNKRVRYRFNEVYLRENEMQRLAAQVPVRGNE